MMYNYPNFTPYYAQQQPMYNQMPQQMQPQQVQIPQNQFQSQGTLFGKVVENIDVFRSSDIPMDGNVYYFPKADGSEVYTKRWLQNGTTEQLVYKRVMEQEEIKVDPVFEKLTSIEEQIANIQEALGKQSKANKKGEQQCLT